MGSKPDVKNYLDRVRTTPKVRGDSPAGPPMTLGVVFLHENVNMDSIKQHLFNCFNCIVNVICELPQNIIMMDFDADSR